MKRLLYAGIAVLLVVCTPFLIRCGLDYAQLYQTEVLRFRGLTYDIAVSGNTTTYSSSAGIIEVEEMGSGQSVFFQYKSFSDTVFHINQSNGITTVYDAQGELLLSGLWQDDNLYDADMQLNEAYQVLRRRAENTRPEIGPTAVDALQIAASTLVTTRGRGYIFKAILFASILLFFAFIGIKSRIQMGELRSKYVWREKTRDVAVQWLEEVDEAGKSIYSGSIMESPLLYVALFIFVILMVLCIDIA